MQYDKAIATAKATHVTPKLTKTKFRILSTKSMIQKIAVFKRICTGSFVTNSRYEV